MGTFFGTDGIRGQANRWPMTPDIALKVGMATGLALLNGDQQHRVVIGKDTRLSGYMIENALVAGFTAVGVNVFLLGPVPTPGVAMLTRSLRADIGVMISSSHNPYEDNGIKIFGADGYKLKDAREDEIEALLDDELACVGADAYGKAQRIEDARGRYIEFCKSTFRAESLAGMKIALDCAHGASYQVAPLILQELGAELISIGTRPDGTNINRDCGSTKPQRLQDAVVENNADIGVALDGDADRCLLVNRRGELIDGDAILYILARDRQRRGKLHGPVVGTLMSNYGLEQALARQDIAFERAKVGDRYVFERMLATQATLGGEPSGHVLVRDRAQTGDGIVTALQVLAVMVNAGAGLGAARDRFEVRGRRRGRLRRRDDTRRGDTSRPLLGQDADE